jgi:hypothetical protein
MREIKISVFKKMLGSKDTPYNLKLEDVFNRIKTGKSKYKVEDIREARERGDKKAQGKLKQELPCIIFGGTFIERNKNGLEQHSGLMVIDLDKYPTQLDMLEDLERLKENKHIVSLFISPSGNGIKGVVKIPVCTAKEHSQYFKEFANDLNNEFFDISNSNVDRICFESYDPNIYVNWEAETFEPVLIDEGFNVAEKVPLLPLNDEDKIISFITNFKWIKDFVDGQRNNFILDVSSAFCEYGVSQYKAISFLSNWHKVKIDGDFTQNELERTVKSAYRIRSENSKYFEDYDKLNRIKSDLKKGKEAVINKHHISEEIYNEIKEESENEDFWFYDDKENVKLDALKFKLFLERNGFKKYFPNEAQRPTWVRVVSNKVKETSVEKIKDFVLDYLMDRAQFDVWSYCAKLTALFSENYLSMLDTIELLMLKDEKYKSYIAFRNGILEVTKDKAELIDYIDVDGYIWENHIINRDFEPVLDDANDYKTFVNNIASGEPLPIETVIGYLLSTYKNKMNNKAIILNDETITENPEGGTGKGLFIQGIKQIRRTSILDGKTFDDKKSFPYQTVSQETNVLVFDDVKKNFNFESKFSLVTEGLTLERKNKDAIKLTVEQSPKLVISTNYAIKGEGNSHDRRRHEIEFSQYYGKNANPFDEFGRQLFDDWSESDFLAFDNYMINCLQMYLKEGLVIQNAKNLKQRKFIAETAFEFSEWIKDSGNFKVNSRITKIVAFNDFIEEYQDFKKWLTRKKFSSWVKKYADFKGYDYQDGNSNGSRWFQLTDNNTKFEDDEDEIF